MERPPLTTSQTASTILSSSPTLYEKYPTTGTLQKGTARKGREREKDEVESFLQGGRSNSYSDSSSSDAAGEDAASENSRTDDTITHLRRRWSTFSLSFLVVLFLASCGGASLSGLYFSGIGEVKNLKGQGIAQGLVMCAVSFFLSLILLSFLSVLVPLPSIPCHCYFLLPPLRFFFTRFGRCCQVPFFSSYAFLFLLLCTLSCYYSGLLSTRPLLD